MSLQLTSTKEVVVPSHHNCSCWHRRCLRQGHHCCTCNHRMCPFSLGKVAKKKRGSFFSRLLLLRDAWIIRECVWSLYLNLNLNVIFQAEVQLLNIKLFSSLTCWFAALHRSLAPEINHYYLRRCKISYFLTMKMHIFAGQDSKALQRF